MAIPGFVDLQVNGYKGVDFSSPSLSEDEILYAADALIRAGTLFFLPTIITSSVEVYRRNLALLRRVVENTYLRDHIPGVHLEGPFISPEEGYRGVHREEWIRVPSVDFLHQLTEASGNFIRLLTMAAEQPGAEEVCRYAVSKGIVVSLGHQHPLRSHIDALARAGASCLTHLGNAIPQMIHRYENALWPALINDALMAMVVADGFHVSKELLEIIIRIKGVDKVIVTSDVSPVGGMPPGTYHLLGIESVLEENGRLHCPQTNSLAGSSFTMLQCANFLLSCSFVSPEEVEKMTFYNPLRLLGISPQTLLQNKPLVSFRDNQFIPL